MADYFHLSGGLISNGSIIEAGNWGRIIKLYGWQHNQAIREAALEDARLKRYPTRPSRLECSFCFVTLGEAQEFRRSNNGFQQHVLYRVKLTKPEAPKHLTDSRLCAPQGLFRADWADIYWMDEAAQAASIPGIDWTAATGGVQLREMLTLSNLAVQERLN